jgi:hypothetical protein
MEQGCFYLIIVRRTHRMKRLAFAAALLLAVGSLATGCRSCQSPYDYDSPVADCTCTGCTACGNCRAGSVLSGGYATEAPYEYYEGDEYAPATPTEAAPYESVDPMPAIE